MVILKCKICGGTLEFTEGSTICKCEYCGTKQSLPKLPDKKRLDLYERANHFRRNNEFDKAMGIYEQILNDDTTDAEAYWSLVLCRYGIEYVEDPASHKRIPTINRAQFISVFDDENYKSALQYANDEQKALYQEEAGVINDIQKDILAISQKEEPFDIFICYKETDDSGRRTPDSVLATEMYRELTREGYKVFFSRITLEDKLGTAYEPYIFAALNSAKIMIVLGTKPEYFNAVWVKNEWSRFLGLIKNGERKTLIPAYRDMSAYDLPEAFSHLQAQDMSKIGAMQDIVLGVEKILNKKSAIQPQVALQAAAQASAQNDSKSSSKGIKITIAVAIVAILMVFAILAMALLNMDWRKEAKPTDASSESTLSSIQSDDADNDASEIVNHSTSTTYTTTTSQATTTSTRTTTGWITTATSRTNYSTTATTTAWATTTTTASVPYSYTKLANGICITKYEGSSENVTIPAKIDGHNVVEIGGYAFSECKFLKYVTIPSSVTSIGNSAFNGCTSLKTINIPSSVTSIDDAAFCGCISLTSVSIPNSVTFIDVGTFASCSSLTSITLPNNINGIDQCAFQGCSSLTSINIPDSVTRIENNAFTNCPKLNTVYFESEAQKEKFKDCFGSAQLIVR